MSTSDHERRVDEAIAAYLQAHEAGVAPQREAFLAAHAELRDELASFLDARELLHRRAPIDSGATLAPDAPTGGFATVKYFGDYELLSELARGGMGVVYKARQVSLNRVVALKMILAGSLAGEQEVARFRTEAESAANLDHPNVCPIYEVGEHHGQQYYAMKLIPAGSLAARVAHLVRQPREAVAILAKVADAVQHAHERGILHRDLKPANVLLDEADVPYVSDFGLARKIAGAGMTQTGAIVGTPAYMAPEQARAEKTLTAACDVYSLGAILYECLTGQQPFSGPSPLDVVLQVLDRPPVPPRQINARAPRDLETIALKCLAKEPSQRYGSAQALADELRRWLDGRPIQARPAGRAQRAWRWCRRNPVVAGLCASLLLVFLAGFAATAWKWREASANLSSALQSEQNEAEARREAEKVTKQARWQLARQYISRGYAELERGDVLSSLPWYVEALAIEDDDPDRAAVHRRRFGELLRYCPRMKHVLAHEGTVSLARLSDDGKYVLTSEAIDDQTHGRFWDAASGERLSDPWPAPFREAVFSPDGRRMALLLYDFTVLPTGHSRRCEVREVPSGRILATIEVPKYSARTPTWHPSGKSLLVCYATAVAGREDDGWESTIVARLFDTATGKPLAPEIQVNNRSIFWTRFSPDGKLLATLAGDSDDVGGGKTTCHLHDALTGAVLAELPGDDITGLEFEPQGRTFVTVHRAGGGRLWDVRTRKPLESFVAGERATRLTWGSDGRHLLAAHYLKPPRWLAPNGEVDTPGTGRPAPDWPAGPGRMVLTGGDDGVWLWHPLANGRHDLPTPLKRIACPHPPKFAQIAPDGRTLLTLHADARLVHLWDVGVRPCARDTMGSEPSGTRYEVRGSQDGESATFVGYDRHQDSEPFGPLRFACPRITYLQSADEKRLFVLRERTPQQWELRGYDVPSLNERFAPVDLGTLLEVPTPKEVHAAGGLALVCQPSRDSHEVRVFDDARLRGTVAVGPRPELRFSADGGTFAAVWVVGKGREREAFCRAWTLPDMRPSCSPVRLAHPEVMVGQVSPDGRHLAVALESVRGQVIDLASGEVVGTLPAGAQPRAFLSDGRLFTASTGGARLWDFRAGKPLTMPMPNCRLEEGIVPGPSPVLTCVSGNHDPLAYDALTGERITVPAAVGVTQCQRYPVETRPVEQLRLLSGVLSGRRLDTVGAVTPLEPGEYVAAWQELCERMPEARGLTAEEELDWHADEAAVAESWRDWKAAEPHRRWLLERSPQDGPARQRLANVLAEQGRWADARREYEAAAERLDNPFAARVDAAWISLAAGEQQRAGAAVAALFRDHHKTNSPARAGELLPLAALAGDAEAAKQALAIYRRIDELRGGHPLAWAALIQSRAGRPKEALTLLRGDENKGDDTEYLLLSAAVLKRAGEAKEADEVLEGVKQTHASYGWRVHLIERLLWREVR